MLIEKGAAGKGFKASASEESWAGTLATFERVYTFTLGWIASHPVISLCGLLFAGWWLRERSSTKVKIAGLKSDYQTMRERSRIGAPQSRRRKD